MGMTDEEIEATQFDLDQDQLRNAKAADERARREAVEWAGLDEPKPVTDSILDADPKTAAWLWAREHFMLVNEDERDSCMGVVNPARYAGFDVEVTCFDKQTVMSKAM